MIETIRSFLGARIVLHVRAHYFKIQQATEHEIMAVGAKKGLGDCSFIMMKKK